MASRYLIALGSNVRHRRFGPPRAVLRAAMAALEREGLVIEACSPVVETRPHGPSLRRYANAAAVVATALDPDRLLARLKALEQGFGRRRGRRWSARVLDLDIILWEGGAWSTRDLTIPHVAFRHRDFVLKPAAAIAGEWRDPVTGLTVRHLAERRYNF